MFRRLAIAVALLCAGACGGSEVPTHTPEASSETVAPPSAARSARAFVRALAASNVNELGPTVAYPLSFRLRRGDHNCPDAATAAELAAWVACVHEHIGQAFRAWHSLETLAVHIYPSRAEVGEDVLRTLPNTGTDDVFVRVNLFGSPTNVTIVLHYQRRPSLAVRTVWAGLGHELSSSTKSQSDALLLANPDPLHSQGREDREGRVFLRDVTREKWAARELAPGGMVVAGPATNAP